MTHQHVHFSATSDIHSGPKFYLLEKEDRVDAIYPIGIDPVSIKLSY